MGAIESVLVGIDAESPDASAVLVRATQITDASHIRVVHACDHLHHARQPFPVGAFADGAALDAAVQRQVDERLAGLCAPFGIRDSVVLDGEPVHVLHEQARHASDLLIVGSHGSGGWRLLLGSKPNAVIHGTTCDVLAVHVAEGDTQPLAYRRILVAVDLTRDADDLLQHAQRIVDRSDANVDLCYVHQQAIESPHSHRQHHAQAHDRLLDFAGQHGIAETRCHLLQGTPARAIRRLADQLHTDLLVIGTHGKTGVRLVTGSTANSILHGARYDVLAARVHD